MSKTYVFLTYTFSSHHTKKVPLPMLITSFSLYSNRWWKNGADFLLKFLLPWVCVFLPTWEGEFMFDLDCFFIFMFLKNLMFFLASNTHWNQVYYNLCLWVLNWLLGLGFEYISKKLGMISQIMNDWWKSEKKNPIFQEFSPNFQPLPES